MITIIPFGHDRWFTSNVCEVLYFNEGYPEGRGSKGVRFGFGKGISSVTNTLGTYKAYMDIYNGHHSILNWTDAFTGTVGVSVSSLELAGYNIPYVGEGLIIYTGLRLYYDYYNSQNNPSPIWNRLRTYKPSNYVPTITNPYKP